MSPDLIVDFIGDVAVCGRDDDDDNGGGRDNDDKGEGRDDDYTQLTRT